MTFPIPPNQIMICTFSEGLLKHPPFFANTGFGVEISDFAYARNLDASDVKKRVQKIKEAVSDISGTLSLHAPYRNMDPASPDEKIRQICRDRYLRVIDIAHEIRATQIVFHANYNPLYASKGYDKQFLERAIPIYDEMIEAAGNSITLNLENMFEDCFDRLTPLFTHFAGKLKLLLDSGHLNVYSESPAVEWVKLAGAHLNYLHLNDNPGNLDRHNAIGTGTFDFQAFFQSMKNIKPNLSVEVKNFPEVLASLKWLKEHQIIDAEFEKYA